MTFTSCDPQAHEGQTNTWLTPRWILDALGPFDLDPAAHPSWKIAREHFYDRGLDRPWHGRVWLNPPYGRSVGEWLKKLENHGNGIALVFARTDTKWFHELTPDGICFVRGRVKFLRDDLSEATNAGTPSMLLAWGIKNVNAISLIPGRLIGIAWGVE